MEQALLISPFLILLAGLVFHAASHLNCGPVEAPRNYIPLIHVFLITISVHLNNYKRNQKRSKLLLKFARCEIPDNKSFIPNSASNYFAFSPACSPIHSEKISQIYKTVMNPKAALSLNLNQNELKVRRGLKTGS